MSTPHKCHRSRSWSISFAFVVYIVRVRGLYRSRSVNDDKS